MSAFKDKRMTAEGCCDWCKEPILAFDRTATFQPPVHWECGLRALEGGVNCQLGICKCCQGGAFPPDPPDLSRREAAKAAADLWVSNLRKHYPFDTDDDS